MKLRKKLLILTVFLFTIIIGLSFYLEKVFLPEKIEKLTVSFLKEKLDLETDIDSVHFSLWKGIELTDWVVKNPSGFQNKTLLKVKRAFLKPAFLPLLRKRLIISAILIENPQFSLERKQNGDWNVRRLFDALQKKPAPVKESLKKPLSFQVHKVIIRKGKINFIDNQIEPPFSRHIKEFNLSISPLGRHLALSYYLELFIESDETKAEIHGKIFPLTKRGGMEINIQHLNLAGFLPYFNEFTTFSFDNGYLDLNAELSANKAGLTGQCSLNLSEAVFFLKDIYDRPLVFSNGKIATQIFLDNESEEIKFQNSSFSIGGININGSGQLKSFKTNPEFSFDFSTPLLDFKDITFAFPTATFDFYKSLTAEGPFQISNGKIFMPFKRMPETNYKFKTEIKKGGFSLPFLSSRIKNIKGNLIFDEKKIEASNLQAQIEKMPFSFSGSWGLKRPRDVELKLTGKEINLKTRAKLFKDSGELLDLSGSYRDIPIKAHGKFKKLSPLTVDWQIESSPLQLDKLIKILPAGFNQVYKKLGLAGTANFKANLLGELGHWKTWQSNGNLSFPELQIKKLKLKEFSCPFNLQRQKLSLPDLKAAFYNGSIRGNFQINLIQPEPSHQGNFLFSNINLAELTEDTDWKDKDIQGLAGAEINFNGSGVNWKQLKGNGWVQLSGSRLWEIPLLGKLTNILLIPGLDKSIIREGHCNFNINQERAYTKDLKLLSDNVSLEAKGSVGFDSTLDFDILMQFSGAFRKEAKTLTKLADLVLKTVEYLLIQVELKGTIADPEYNVLPFPIEKILRKEIKKKLGDLLQDLLKKKE